MNLNLGNNSLVILLIRPDHMISAAGGAKVGFSALVPLGCFLQVTPTWVSSFSISSALRPPTLIEHLRCELFLNVFSVSLLSSEMCVS